MSALQIDFAPRSWRRVLANTSITTWTLGFVALLCCAYIGWQALDITRRIEQQEMMLTGLRAQHAKQVAHQPVVTITPIPPAQATSVNRAIAQLNLPWSAVLDALEAATPATVALLSIEPNAQKQILRTTAEAKTPDLMVAYIEELKRQPFLTSVVLTKHEINEQDPNKPIRFVVEATWSEPAP